MQQAEGQTVRQMREKVAYFERQMEFNEAAAHAAHFQIADLQAQLAATRAPFMELWAAPDGRRRLLVPVECVRFTHDAISPQFSNGPHRGRGVHELVDQLAASLRGERDARLACNPDDLWVEAAAYPPAPRGGGQGRACVYVVKSWNRRVWQ